jgi:hypothetical protein
MVDTRLRLDGKDLIVHSYQDVEDIIENNKRLKSIPQRSDWGRHIADIPNNILNQWLSEEWARGNVNLKCGSEGMKRIIKKKLQDHDWLFLRTDK